MGRKQEIESHIKSRMGEDRKGIDIEMGKEKEMEMKGVLQEVELNVLRGSKEEKAENRKGNNRKCGNGL